MGAVGLLLGFGLVPSSVRDLRVGASPIVLVRQGPARVTRPAASISSRTPSGPSVRAGDDLQVHPVHVVLAGVERPVRGHPVDGISVPSKTT
jgi:hypothetical protein